MHSPDCSLHGQRRLCFRVARNSTNSSKVQNHFNDHAYCNKPFADYSRVGGIIADEVQAWLSSRSPDKLALLSKALARLSRLRLPRVDWTVEPIPFHSEQWPHRCFPGGVMRLPGCFQQRRYWRLQRGHVSRATRCYANMTFGSMPARSGLSAQWLQQSAIGDS